MFHKQMVSIHAPHAGRDVGNHAVVKINKVSIHAPHAGRDGRRIHLDEIIRVSIHAPHAGRDQSRRSGTSSFQGFNPRAPCGARLQLRKLMEADEVFQSTRPMRGATAFASLRYPSRSFQSTRPMRGATAKEVTTSLFCHIFMGITRHKYDFLDV